MAAITEGRAGALVVSKRDRLARDMSLAGYIETTIKRSGAELIVLDEQDVSPITR
jgi:DNA invertase Pin-like site-specific DNA recombinase